MPALSARSYFRGRKPRALSGSAPKKERAQYKGSFPSRHWKTKEEYGNERLDVEIRKQLARKYFANVRTVEEGFKILKRFEKNEKLCRNSAELLARVFAQATFTGKAKDFLQRYVFAPNRSMEGDYVRTNTSSKVLLRLRRDAAGKSRKRFANEIKEAIQEVRTQMENGSKRAASVMLNHKMLIVHPVAGDWGHHKCIGVIDAVNTYIDLIERKFLKEN
jgi:hypothetical protein